ncbi:MAG TPA: tRNA uridine(34) 5-carboxymethylaminomethyl modification radical SAM/GNAT enzyme Elp3 [Candidatus Thermoplasmatota archaeon]|nr:tRNA uridine(34) 5-carboxymethylaminomethyl modification radical SAM/GNAT enzyme Elp3 [Candidatus Thermoplasmatota archaeon]
MPDPVDASALTRRPLKRFPGAPEGAPKDRAIPTGPHVDAFFEDIIARLLAGEAATKDQVQNLKIRLCEEHRLNFTPSNADILGRTSGETRQKLLPLLRMKPTRSASGVSIVTIQSSPASCPHGKCIYCPGGPEYGTAQSYTGQEPAALRAARHQFDAYGQTAGRLVDLSAIGHPVDKIDLIVQGGTITARPKHYQEEFLRRAFDAMNAFENPGYVDAPDLETAHRVNETAKARCIGLTLETKPDWCFEPHVDHSLALGCTRIELGIQSVHDRHLEITHRGHTAADSLKAIQVVKDAGLKLCLHLMPGLPGATYEEDLETFRQVFEEPAWRPDMIKIYPTLVMPGTELYEMWSRGEYQPVAEDYAIRLIREATARFLPEWVRIQRMDRDIPSTLVAAGVKKSNLRELVEDGIVCRCIRCREAGHAANKRGVVPDRIERRALTYDANGGREHFLQLEDPDKDLLVGFVRVREPSPLAHRPEVREGAVFLRELKVFGSEVPIGEAPDAPEKWQHRGFGRELVEATEEIARSTGARKVLVTAGVGVRNYYRKLGYEREGPYMMKRV